MSAKMEIKRLHKNPKCWNCGIPMRKKGSFRIGEKRFKCPKCGKEA